MKINISNIPNSAAMTRIVSSKHRAASEANNLHRQRATTTLVAILGAQVAVKYAATYLIKEPMYDSAFTGSAWVQELLNGLLKPIRKCGMHFFSWFSWLIEPYSTFFLINLSLYNVGPKPSILSGPNGREPSKIR